MSNLRHPVFRYPVLKEHEGKLFCLLENCNEESFRKVIIQELFQVCCEIKEAEAILLTLSNNEREILRLRYWEKKSVKEIINEIFITERAYYKIHKRLMEKVGEGHPKAPVRRA